MISIKQKIIPHLWFDKEAEEGGRPFLLFDFP